MGGKLALEADVCYNKLINVVAQAMLGTSLSVRRKHWRFSSMDILSSSAENGKSSFSVKFWSKVDTSGDCWLWTAARDRKGYGRFHTTYGTGKPHHLGAHRMAYILAYGDIASDLEVCHRCDNPPCVNPDHLFLATHAQNMADQYAKGRNSPPPHEYGSQHWHNRMPEKTPKGEKHANAKLTLEQVKDIRASYVAGRLSLQQLANQYGVTKSCIHSIVKDKGWKRVS